MIKNATEKFINEALSNVLNEVCCTTRVAVYLRDNKLICYLHGGKKVVYDPVENDITSEDFKLNQLVLHVEVAKKLYKKLTSIVSEDDQTQILKEKYGITKKRIGEKGLAEIAKYEACLKKGIGGA